MYLYEEKTRSSFLRTQKCLGIFKINPTANKFQIRFLMHGIVPQIYPNILRHWEEIMHMLKLAKIHTSLSTITTLKLKNKVITIDAEQLRHPRFADYIVLISNKLHYAMDKIKKQ